VTSFKVDSLKKNFTAGENQIWPGINLTRETDKKKEKRSDAIGEVCEHVIKVMENTRQE
jgi:hypothetical protein